MPDESKKGKQKELMKEAKERTSKSFDKAETLNRKLKQEYEKALSDIQTQIADFYMRYAKANNVSYSEAVQTLSKVEIDKLQSDLKDFISQVEIDDPALKSELTALSIKKRITRLEGLMGRIKTECYSLEILQQDQVSDHLGNVCSENYNETISGLKDVLGFSKSFSALSPKLIEETINYPWSGEMFSERIWNNRQALVRSLKQELVQGFIQGKSIQGMANSIAKKIDGSYKNALAVVRTETANVVNQSTILGYKESGVVEEFQFLAVLDGDTSNICRELYLQHDVYKLSEAKVGVNVPPLHPNCRSTIVPYFGDE